MTREPSFEQTEAPHSTESGFEAAAYARYSDDKQRESSIEDQVRVSRGGARRDGGFIPDTNIFKDPDVRGATESRPGLDRLLDLIRSGNATFRDLYISDTSRLARNSAFAPQLRKFFDFHGIRLHFVENGMKSGNSGFVLQHTLQSYADEQYSHDLGQKTLRGTVGCVLKGYVPSGRCYGYKNVPEEHPTMLGLYGRPEVIGVRQVPYPPQVDVINEIYRMYKDGEGGYTYIAQQLNIRGFAAPGKSYKNSVGGWNHAAVRTILMNERYIGNVIFGKTKALRNPETHKIKNVKVPESEWIRFKDQSLRIVSDELWEGVRKRQTLICETFGGVKAGGIARSKATKEYLFGGLLRCGDCGNSMVLTNGPGGNYKCGNARRKAGCNNTLLVKRKSLERELVSNIASTLRSGANLNEIKIRFTDALSAELKLRKKMAETDEGSREQLLRERHQLTTALGNLTEEISDHGGSDAIRSAIRRKESRLTVIANVLKRIEVPVRSVTEAEIETFLRTSFVDLAKVILAEPARAKQEFMERISALTLTPTSHDGVPAYIVTGDLRLFSPNEVVMLHGTEDYTTEHHSFVISVGPSILKIDSHFQVVGAVPLDPVQPSVVRIDHAVEDPGTGQRIAA